MIPLKNFVNFAQPRITKSFDSILLLVPRIMDVLNSLIVACLRSIPDISGAETAGAADKNAKPGRISELSN